MLSRYHYSRNAVTSSFTRQARGKPDRGADRQQLRPALQHYPDHFAMVAPSAIRKRVASA
jgi:hypothetical protein